MKLRDVVTLLETVLPRELIEDGDNSGLLIGDMDSDISHIRTALEASEEVLAKAIEDGVDLLLVHHPMIFSPVATVTSETLRGRKTMKMIRNGIALYAAHSNLDRTVGGLNQRFGQQLGFQKARIYDEEGYILISELEMPVTLSDYVNEVREKLGCESLRYVGRDDREIATVAYCTGSGMGLLDDGLFEEADVYITGDLKYHMAMDLHESDYAVIDVGHFGSEAIAAEVLYDLVTGVVDTVDVSADRSIVNPIKQ